MEPPPPPPPPHGANPQTTEGTPRYRKASDLPNGNYDIFVIPPHSSGSGFLYLPSLQCHRNSFFAGVLTTLAIMASYVTLLPIVKGLFSAMAPSGMSIVAAVLVSFLLGWFLGMMQQDGIFSAGRRSGGPSKSGSGSANTPSGNPPGGNSSSQTSASNAGNTFNAGTAQTPPPQPQAGPQPQGGPQAQGGPQSQAGHQAQAGHQTQGGPQAQSAAGSQQKSSQAEDWERAREETRRKEEIRRKMEAFRKKREEEEAERRRQREREALEKEFQERKEQLEREAAAAREAAEREAAALREAIEREAAALRAAAEAKEKAEKEAAEREAAAREALKREATARFQKAKEAAAKKFAEAKEASEASKKPSPAPSPASSPQKKATPTSTKTATDDDAYSFRPYDRPRRPYHTSSSSVNSESSYAPSHTTARTTPPPSNREPYATKDPDKVVIRGVYLFNNAFQNTPTAKLVSGQGSVTDGLILRITTEGLFIDDDLRGVAQREWDVKAWTMKLVEVSVSLPACLSCFIPSTMNRNTPLFKLCECFRNLCRMQFVVS